MAISHCITDIATEISTMRGHIYQVYYVIFTLLSWHLWSSNVFRKSSQLGQVCPHITCQMKNGQFHMWVLTSSGQLMAISHCYWHLVVKNSNFTFLLTSSGHRMAISHCYWHLVVKNGNFTLLLTSSDHRMAISHCYWHLVVKNSNLTVLLTSISKQWQFHIAYDIWWSRMATSHCY